MIVVRHDRRPRPAAHGAVGLVPTMGALHDGHAALFAAARPASDVLVASLFVNPAQFSDDGDLGAYPRDLDADAAARRGSRCRRALRAAGRRDLPAGLRDVGRARGRRRGLEEAHRPGHFRGVATMCLKLFNIVRPQVAWFGRKDAQQVAVLKQLVRDLNLDVAIHVVETVRDDDGLALSSRNARLTPAERAQALAIPRALATGDEGRRARVLAAAGLDPDYVDGRRPRRPDTRVATRVGDTRLIDNVLLKGAS